MDLSLLLAIQAVVFLVVGLSFLLIPRQWSGPFGMRLDEGAVFFARTTGAGFLGLAVVDWWVRGASGGTVDAVILGNLVANAVSALVHVRAVTSGLQNRFGWGPIALLVALTAGWAYAWLA